MDPLTALGVASNVINIVDFAGKLFKICIRARSAARSESQELDDIDYLTAGLEKSVRRLSYQQNQTPAYCAESPLRDGNEVALVEIGRKCSQIARDVLQRVATFRATDPNSRRQRARAMLEYIKSRRDTESMMRRLSDYQRQLETHVLISIRHSVLNQAVASAAFFQRFDDREKQIIAGLCRSERGLHDLMSNINSLHTRVAEAGTETRKCVLEDGELTRRHISESFRSKPKDQLEAQIKGLHRSLWFDEADERQANVDDPHLGTTKWILEERSESSHLGLIQWLEGENKCPIYWIAGKPAAGKTTVMKMLASHPQVRVVLAQSASESGLKSVTASHFFWANGEDLQKNLVGMLRSLLFQIFEQFPEHRSFCLQPLALKLPLDEPLARVKWHRGRLLELLGKLQSCRIFVTAITLFIDGLDECSDDHEELISILKGMTQKKNSFRLVVASRPWPLFKSAFESSDLGTSLYLHNHTASDILKYVSDKLRQEPRFIQLSKRSHEQAEEIMHRLTGRANGIFAWIKLGLRQVCKALQHGKIESHLLYEEINRLPEGLAEIYDYTLQRIDPDMRKECAVFLLLYHYFNENEGNRLNWHLCYASKSFLGYLQPIEPREFYDSDKIADTLEFAENATGGLLEVRDNRISILHLTAARWFERTEVQNTLYNWISSTSQDLARTAIEAVLAYTFQPGGDPEITLIFIAGLFLELDTIRPDDISAASRCILDTWYPKGTAQENLTESQKWGKIIWQDFGVSATDEIGSKIASTFATTTVDFNLVITLFLFCMHHCETNEWSALYPHVSYVDLSVILAFHFLSVSSRENVFDYSDSPNQVAQLLDHGAQPDLTIPGTDVTAWQCFIYNVIRGKFTDKSVVLIFQKMLAKTPVNLNKMKLPSQGHDSSTLEPSAIDLIHPSYLTHLKSHGLYEGIIPSESEWIEQAKRFRLPVESCDFDEQSSTSQGSEVESS